MRWLVILGLMFFLVNAQAGDKPVRVKEKERKVRKCQMRDEGGRIKAKGRCRRQAERYRDSFSK